MIPPQQSRFCRSSTIRVVVAAAVWAGGPPPLAGQTDQRPWAGVLRWRSIGPERGGRSLSAAGSPSRPLEYYFGAAGGGLWKSIDGGTTWAPVTDRQLGSASVGAVAVAESNPDVVYVGMGEAQLRSDMLQGDGVYRSTDGGRTWSHIGLDSTQAIARIRIDPRDPDRVYVAALGNPWKPSDERGVFRSTDGGRSWQRILHRDSRSGAADLVIDPNDPGTLYAALWQVRAGPRGAILNGGPGSGLFKSIDGGDTWRELTGNDGLPREGVGAIGIAVSPADSRRVYALIDAPDGGVFRSDDGGDRWRRVNGEGGLRQRPTYFNRIVADPANRDGVWVLNLLLYRSVDGGTSFSTVTGPHVDHHDLWIAPNDSTRMIDANDGGGTVSVTGGATWTATDYPTAQLYRVATTRDLPYHVCGAQQDANTICVPSDRATARSNNPIVGQEEGPAAGYPAGGGESGSIAPHPTDPAIFFATGPQALLSRYDRRLGLSQARDLQVLPSWDSGPTRERFPWTTVLLASRLEAKVLYVGSQHVWRSADEGGHWERISPDLTRSAPIGAGEATISAMALDPTDPKRLWAGTDDGLVHLTGDGGATWTAVTPPGIPDSSRVSAIEPSMHDRRVAYLTVERHEAGDRRPYLFRTRDDGGTWESLGDALPAGGYLNVIREDPTRAGLLYAGTDHGVMVSFDQGDRWESLSLDLPDVPVFDLVVEAKDLVIATHGRSFYVLDDIAPLRQWRPDRPAKPVTVMQPANPIRRLEPGIIDYHLASAATQVTIEILDREGQLVRRYQGSGSAGAPSGDSPPGHPGLNRFRWDLRHQGAAVFPGMILWVSRPIGPLAVPGEYQVRVTADGASDTARFRVEPDPRTTGVTIADLEAQYALARTIRDQVTRTNETVTAIREAYRALDDRKRQPGGQRLAREIDAIIAGLAEAEGELYQVKLKSELDATVYPVKLNNRFTNLQMSIETGDGPPTAQARTAFKALTRELEAVLARLEAIRTGPLAKLNRTLAGRRLEPVILRSAP